MCRTRRGIHVSYEEEDTCDTCTESRDQGGGHVRTRRGIHVSYEEEDTCDTCTESRDQGGHSS
jgi:hypothetical protein